MTKRAPKRSADQGARCGRTDGRSSAPFPHLAPAQEARADTRLPRTLGGNGVLGAARGGRLGAVAAGALQRVPAAPLGVELEAP